MKTLLVVPWLPQRGGVAVATENLARYLEGRGHEVIFLQPGPNVLLRDSTIRGNLQGLTLRVVFPFSKPRPLVSALAFPLIFPVVLIQLILFLRKRQIQIVNVHYAIDNFIYFAICRWLLPIRLVVSLHGGDAFNKGRPKKKYSLAFKSLLRAADLIVLPSSAYRGRLLEAFPAVARKTVFIYNGVDPAQFSRRSFERIVPGRYVLCIADLNYKKGLDILLHAAKSLLEEDRSLSVVVAGDGLLRTSLEELATSLRIREQVQFLGLQTAERIAWLLHGCEVLVLPSREESFGIVLIEAMVCRKTVVASAVGGIPEIIEHRKSGILVEPENPAALTEGLRAVLADPDLRTQLGENGYARVMERFCMDQTGAAYQTAFAKLLDHKSKCSLSRKISKNQAIF